jgi:hyaluronan synthase/N-acetylglucosaminyltransferase
MAIFENIQTRAPERRWAWLRISGLVLATCAAIALVYLSRQRLPWIVVSAYGVVSIGRVALQSVTSAIVRRRKPVPTGQPMVSVIVALLNEAPDLFEQAMRSLAGQDWPQFEVIVIDDGSDDPGANRAVCDRLGIRYAYQANAGKRHALYRGFGMLHPDSAYVLTADSDTVWAPDAIADLVATLQSDERIGAVTGHVATLNDTETWLSRMTARRYWLAFQIERAAQGYFGAVTCVSGPLGGYRRDLIEQIKDAFITQRFLGRNCTFGDDRHLTNLVLGLGYRVAYSPATAWTEVPTRLRPYLRQQLRWSRSFWRESLWTAKALPRQTAWLTLDFLLTTLMPVQLAITVGWFIWHGIGTHPSYLGIFVGTVAAMGLLRVAPAVAATRRAGFLSLVAFGLFYLGLLLPLRFIALVTPTVGTWGSRAGAGAAPALALAATPASEEISASELLAELRPRDGEPAREPVPVGDSEAARESELARDGGEPGHDAPRFPAQDRHAGHDRHQSHDRAQTHDRPPHRHDPVHPEPVAHPIREIAARSRTTSRRRRS